ncbi:hypothetical protein D3C76_1471840 [compost metagenome]
MGQIFVQTEIIFLCGRLGAFRRIEGDGSIHQRREAFQLHFGPAQAQVGIDARDVPEAAAFFHQRGEASFNQHVDGHPLLIGGDGVVVDPAHGDLAEIDQRPAVQ